MTAPPFTGSIDLKLAISAFDVRVLRKARLTYAYMPAWSYFDVRSGTQRSGEFQLEVSLSILALPRSDRSHAASPPAPMPRGRGSAWRGPETPAACRMART